MKNLQHTFQQTVLGVVFATMITGFLTSGAASALGKSEKKGAEKPPANQRTDIFYPAPPDAPRLQYLTGFASEKSFRQKKSHSFKSFITGQQEATKEISKPYGVTDVRP